MNLRNKTKRLSAFTLLELMAVVTIIGILAAVAVPLVSKYLRKSKTTEAAVNLRKIYDGEQAYYYEERTTSAGGLVDKQFVQLGATPATPSDQKQTVNFDTAGFGLIRFNPDGPVLYSYSVTTGGINLSASFTARAQGDLDNDGDLSLFERIATVSATGEVQGGAGIYSLDELE